MNLNNEDLKVFFVMFDEGNFLINFGYRYNIIKDKCNAGLLTESSEKDKRLVNVTQPNNKVLNSLATQTTHNCVKYILLKNLRGNKIDGLHYLHKTVADMEDNKIECMSQQI